MLNKLKERKFISISKTILAILFEIGELHLKAFFPHPYYHTFCNHKSSNAFKLSIARLQKRGFVSIDHKLEKVKLTHYAYNEAKFANRHIKSLIFKNSSLAEGAQNWDRNWRIIVFDIPEKLRNLRDDLRSLISEIGFMEFQKSVWVYPFKVPDFILEALNDAKIKKYVRFLLVSEMDYDWDLRRKFRI